MGPERSMDALKALYHSSHLFADSSHRYVVAKKRRYTREGAWLAVVKRLFDVYGVASAETMGMLLGRDLRMRELRSILRQLERHGHLVKGHLLRGSSTMYWASKEAYSSMGKERFDSDFVLSPEDNLYHFLRASDREMVPPGGRHIVFRGPEPIGSFAGRIRDGTLEVEDIEGDEACRIIIENFARLLGRRTKTRQTSDVSDWEIVDFYEKSHPGMG